MFWKKMTSFKQWSAALGTRSRMVSRFRKYSFYEYAESAFDSFDDHVEATCGNQGVKNASVDEGSPHIGRRRRQIIVNLVHLLNIFLPINTSCVFLSSLTSKPQVIWKHTDGGYHNTLLVRSFTPCLPSKPSESNCDHEWNVLTNSIWTSVRSSVAKEPNSVQEQRWLKDGQNLRTLKPQGYRNAVDPSLLVFPDYSSSRCHVPK